MILTNGIIFENGEILLTINNKKSTLFSVMDYPANCSTLIFYSFNSHGEKQNIENIELLKPIINEIAVIRDSTQILIADIEEGFGYKLATSIPNCTLLNSVFNNNSGNFVFLFSIIVEK